MSMSRDELLNELIITIGQGIEQIGEDLQEHKFEGLAVKMEQLMRLRDAAYAAVEMKRL